MEWDQLGKALVSTLAFSAVGLVIFGLAFWFMEIVAPFSIKKEIEEDQNTALAIIMGSVVVGIALVIMGALLG